MKKLILFGDSLFGRCGKNFMNQLESVLDEEYDVYNCAAGGSNSNDVLDMSEFISTLRADVFVISVGMIDLTLGKQVALADFASNVTKIIDIFDNTKIIFLLPPPVNESRQDKIVRTNSEITRYSEALIEVCQDTGVDYIDLGNDADYHIEDGVHLNKAGYTKIFQLIKEKL